MLNYSFHPVAEKELHGLPLKIHQQIITKIKELCKLGHPLQNRKVKKLTSKKPEQFRLRVGNYRIKFVFWENSKTIKVTHIQHRQVGY